MYFGENTERSKSYQAFRTVMDIGMGLFYTITGGMIAIIHSFAGMAIPVWIAVLLGIMMLVGGLFRLYRGLKAVTARKR